MRGFLWLFIYGISLVGLAVILFIATTTTLKNSFTLALSKWKFYLKSTAMAVLASFILFIDVCLSLASTAISKASEKATHTSRYKLGLHRSSTLSCRMFHKTGLNTDPCITFVFITIVYSFSIMNILFVSYVNVFLTNNTDIFLSYKSFIIL